MIDYITNEKEWNEKLLLIVLNEMINKEKWMRVPNDIHTCQRIWTFTESYEIWWVVFKIPAWVNGLAGFHILLGCWVINLNILGCDDDRSGVGIESYKSCFWVR